MTIFSLFCLPVHQGGKETDKQLLAAFFLLKKRTGKVPFAFFFFDFWHFDG